MKYRSREFLLDHIKSILDFYDSNIVDSAFKGSIMGKKLSFVVSFKAFM